MDASPNAPRIEDGALRYATTHPTPYTLHPTPLRPAPLPLPSLWVDFSQLQQLKLTFCNHFANGSAADVAKFNSQSIRTT